MEGLITILPVIIFLLFLFIVVNGFRILKEYERAVVFRLGRVLKDGAIIEGS